MIHRQDIGGAKYTEPDAQSRNWAKSPAFPVCPRMIIHSPSLLSIHIYDPSSHVLLKHLLIHTLKMIRDGACLSWAETTL
jgi:hypothetical protein